MLLSEKITGFLLLSLLFCNELNSETVYVGIYNNPPKLEINRKGKPRGIFVDVIENVAKKEGWKIVYMEGTWDEGLKRLENGEIDFMPDIAVSDKRKTRFDYNRIAVLSSWLHIYCRKNDTLNSLSSLNNKNIAVLKGSIQQSVCLETCRKLGLKFNIITCPDYQTCIEYVASGKAYAVIVSRFYSYRQEFKSGLTPTSVILHPTSLHFAVKRGENKKLLNAIDKQLAKMMDNPGSKYYKSLSYWLNEQPCAFIPRIIIWIGITITLVVILLFALNVILGRLVKKRTREIEIKNKELAQALENLKNAQDNALKRERLYAIGQMVNGIAHDFNNLLTPIISGVDLICDESINDPEYVKHNLDMIRSAALYGSEIIKRMQSFSRNAIPDEEKSVIDLNYAVKEVLKLLKPGWNNHKKEKVNIEIGFQAGDNVEILAKLSNICELILNLLINASDAMPHGGLIEIITENRGGIVSLTIKDNGVGMTEEIRKKCFEPFFSTKGANGTGMGLAMVNRIVKEHGAIMDIVSSEGSGTKFILAFSYYKSSNEFKKETKFSVS